MKVKKEKKTDKKIEKNLKFKKIKISPKFLFGIIACILIAVFCFSVTPVTLQNDTYYTIKIGELITQNGIDMQDHFSWHENLSYTYPHWLYDLITYFIFINFNFMGIYVTTCILSVILGLTMYFVCSKLSKNNIISFFVTIGAIFLIKNYIAARAQLVTFILFLLVVFFIEKFLEKRQFRYGIGVFVISVLIANMHTAVWPFIFVLFLPYIGEYFVSVIADWVIYKVVKLKLYKIKVKRLSKSKKKDNSDKIKVIEEKIKNIEDKVGKIKVKRESTEPYKIRIKRNDNVKWLILIMVICVLSGFLTPIGDTPFTYLPKTMQGNTTENINEHLPMTLTNHTEVVCALVILLAIMIFTKVKIKLSDLFMIAGLTYLMLLSRRQLSMFALIGSIIYARMILELIETYIKGGIQKVNNIMTTTVLVLIVSLLSVALSSYYLTQKEDKDFVSESSYPVQACDWIKENIDLSTAKFYNEYNYGSYMLFRGIPVFIDSRADLYSPEFSGFSDDIFMDFLEVSGISRYYEDVFDKYGITHVITYKNSKMNMLISKSKDENYKGLYNDKYFVIYQRVNVNDDEVVGD